MHWGVTCGQLHTGTFPRITVNCCQLPVTQHVLFTITFEFAFRTLIFLANSDLLATCKLHNARLMPCTVHWVVTRASRQQRSLTGGCIHILYMCMAFTHSRCVDFTYFYLHWASDCINTGHCLSWKAGHYYTLGHKIEKFSFLSPPTSQQFPHITPFFPEQCTIVATVHNCEMCFPWSEHGSQVPQKKPKKHLIAPILSNFKDK